MLLLFGLFLGLVFCFICSDVFLDPLLAVLGPLLHLFFIVDVDATNQLGRYVLEQVWQDVICSHHGLNFLYVSERLDLHVLANTKPCLRISPYVMAAQILLQACLLGVLQVVRGVLLTFLRLFLFVELPGHVSESFEVCEVESCTAVPGRLRLGQVRVKYRSRHSDQIVEWLHRQVLLALENALD